MTVLDFVKNKNKKISVITAYDFTFASIINASAIDAILVGDSAAMVVHGFDSTIHATIEMMRLHTAAVSRGAPDKFIIADMPFLTFRKGLGPAMDAVEKLMQAGADAVKLEGVDGHEDIISHIVKSGIPVMGHLGLTPQSVNALGGHKVQGKDSKTAIKILDDSKKLEELGCFSMVLECMPRHLAGEITGSLSIPTIGIGAGPDVDGQVLVLQDMLGLNTGFKPKFLRRFSDGREILLEALNNFDLAVKNVNFPTEKESYL